MKTWHRSRLILAATLFLGLAQFGTAWAQVKVTSATPSSTYQGTISLDVVIAGSGFDNSSKADFFVTGTTNPGGVIVKKTVFHNSKEIVATIDVADAATIARFDVVVTLDTGRKGKGTTLFAVQSKTSDPCASAIEFPAFTYWKQSGSTQQIYLADSTGTCSRPLFLVTNGYNSGATQVFSYPVAGTANVGRLLIAEGRYLYVLDFAVSGTTLSIGTKRRVFDSWISGTSGGLAGFDLSKDGTTAYIAVMPLTLTEGSRIYALNIDTGGTQEIFVGAPDGSVFDELAIDPSGAALFVGKQPVSGPYQLLRISLPCSSSCSSAIYTNPPGYSGPPYPAVSSQSDPLLGYPLLVYTDWNGCSQLRFSDLSGTLVYAGTQPRYGVGSTWYRDKVLTNGVRPPDRRGICARTDYVTQIDPSTGAEVQLLRGYDPDGR